MLEEHLNDNRKEHYCFHCGEPSHEVVETISGDVGCEHCTQECAICLITKFKDDENYYYRSVKTYENHQVVWKKGMVCSICDSDPDWKGDIKIIPEIFG